MSAAPDAVATRVLHPFTIVAACVVCAVSFAPAYGLYRFHDDWRFVDFAANAVATGSVDRLILRPLEQHWSPLWHSLEVANFLIAGWEADWFIRTINLLATFGSMVVLSWLLRSAGLSNLAVGGAIGVMAFHHLAATARYSFDTYSQCLADLAVWSASANVAVALIRTDTVPRRTLVWAGVTIGCGLLMKEQALSGVAIVSLMLVLAALLGVGVTWRRAAAGVGGFALLAAVFAVTRYIAGVTTAAEGPFRLCVECVPLNAAQLSVGLVMPLRPLEVVEAYRGASSSGSVIVAAAATTLAMSAVVVSVVTRNWVGWSVGRDRLVVLAAAGCVGAWFPTALLGNVGELYAHTGLFWWAAIIGCVIDLAARKDRPHPTLAIAFTVAYVSALAVGLSLNLRDMRASGERARWYLEQIVAVTTPIPDGHALLVRSPFRYREAGDYGVIRVRNPQVLVMTGLSPASIRYVLRERLAVFHEEALHDPRWGPQIAAAEARGTLHEVELAADGARLLR